jgi:putative membrane protein
VLPARQHGAVTTDAWLAIFHHLEVFGLLATLVAEVALLRPGLAAADVARLARVDGLYGMTAVLVVVAGISRLVWGATPWDFYSDNPTFWLKMAAFATVGLLSIAPTMRYLRWRRDGTAPTDAEVAAARRVVTVELAVFPLIPVFAALMARGIGT